MIGVFFSLMIVAIGIWWVFLPLFSETINAHLDQDIKDHKREELLDLYEQVVSAVRDLDDDYRAGKISKEDYEQDRKVWSARGVDLLAALDQLDGGHLASSQSVDAAIEAAVARYASSHR
jgi:hypothetical protein